VDHVTTICYIFYIKLTLAELEHDYDLQKKERVP